MEEKPTTLFAIRAQKAASALSNSRPIVDEGEDVYKTHPVFTSIVEPFANQFMTLKELIEVNSFANHSLQSMTSISRNYDRLV